MFSVVLDYGDHTASPPTPKSDTPYCSSIIFPKSRPPGRTANGGIQLLDLAGSGQLDVVELTDPDPGFFKRTTDGGLVISKRLAEFMGERYGWKVIPVPDQPSLSP
jgi:hypothetical protein